MKNKLQDLQPQPDKLHGIYRGVVECRFDPLFAGRIKVRIWGIHTQVRWVKTPTHGIPIEELPWAQPVNGIFQGSINGYGVSTVPILGAHVLLFFENGNIMQPRYFATVPAIPEKREDFELGFTDPCDNYPKDERLEEPDFHRLAREDTAETCIEWRIINKHIEIQTASQIMSVIIDQECDAIAGPCESNEPEIKAENDPQVCMEREICSGGKAPCPDDWGSWKGEGQPIIDPVPVPPLISPEVNPSSALSINIIAELGDPWEEPEPFYDADYPHNTVLATHQGILFEIDNSDCKRRIHLYHPSNTFIEIGEQGDVTLKNKTDWIEIVGKNKKKFVWKDEIMSVDGNQSLRVGQNQDLEVLQDKGEIIHGNSVLFVGKDIACKYNGHYNIFVNENKYTRVIKDNILSVEENNCKVVWKEEKYKVYEDAVHKYEMNYNRRIKEEYDSIVEMSEYRRVDLSRHHEIKQSDYYNINISKHNHIGLHWKTTTGGFQHQLALMHIALDSPMIFLNCGVATPSSLPLEAIEEPFEHAHPVVVIDKVYLPYPESPDTKLPYKWY